MKVLFTILLISISLFSFSQEELSEKEIAKFQKGEQALLEYMYMFAYDTIPFETRVKNIHAFIPRFVGLLKEKNSYLYPFDSLLYLSKVSAPDNAFKIFTWELQEPLKTYRYYGVVQLNSKDLKIEPLFDFSDTMDYHPQVVLNSKNWYGAIYYKCVLNFDENNNKYYTLFGLDRADFVSNRKIVEILTFDKQEKIHFGEKSLLAYYDKDDKLIKRDKRLFIEYNDKSKVHLNFNQEKEEIVYDHITPPSEKEKDAAFTYIPDGTYDGFFWEKNFWKSVNRVYDYSIDQADSPPVPHPQGDGRKKDMFGN